ncbi:MAG: preprotein translocase subunit SecE [Trueperaceae bacterium]
MFKGFVRYLRNSRAELGRVTWPTRKEVVQATEATLLFVVITALFLLVADVTLGNLIRFVI